jgi:hypothetical protein
VAVVGDTIWFDGQDLSPSAFLASVGGFSMQVLAGGTSTRIGVRAPSQRVTGDLVVGHSTPDSRRTLRSDYRVAQPQINTILPTTVQAGSRLELTGSDLDFIEAMPVGTARVVKLGNNSTSYGTTFFLVDEWSASRSRVTMKVGASVSVNQGPPLSSVVNAQPLSVTSAFRAKRGGSSVSGSNDMTVAGPTITWEPPVRIDSIGTFKWSQSGPAIPFLLLDMAQQLNNKAFVYGASLDQAIWRVGSRDVGSYAGPTPTSAYITLPPGTPTGYVEATKGTVTARSPTQIWVITKPRVNDPPSPIAIKLDTAFTLYGSALVAPTTATGLSYILAPVAPAMLALCNLGFAVNQHTASGISISFKKLGGIPKSCDGLFEATSPQLNLRLAASYGGDTLTLWQRPVYLVLK